MGTRNFKEREIMPKKYDITIKLKVNSYKENKDELQKVVDCFLEEVIADMIDVHDIQRVIDKDINIVPCNI